MKMFHLNNLDFPNASKAVKFLHSVLTYTPSALATRTTCSSSTTPTNCLAALKQILGRVIKVARDAASDLISTLSTNIYYTLRNIRHGAYRL
jgi:hypothetical protein